MIARPIGLGLASAAVILLTSVLARFLQASDLIDAETVKRMVSVVIGLYLAVWGNYMPKRWGAPVATGCAPSRARSVTRVGGWAMTLAGLVFAAAWAFATCGQRTAKRAPTPF